MMAVDLIGCYWTLGGNYVFGEHDHSPFDFRDRVEAAAAVGYRGFGLKHADLLRSQQQYGIAGMRAIFADHGITEIELEALFDWSGSGPARQASDRTRHDLLRAAEQLGAHHIKAAGDFTDAAPDLAKMRDEFQLLARQARDAGTVIALEPIPFANIRDLPTALTVIGDSVGQGGGLMLDSWHVARGNILLADIAALPAAAIAAVELDDGTLETVGTPLEDTIHRRRLCGEGQFDLRGLIAAVRRAGYDGPFGVEILSAEQRARPLRQAAELSFATTARLFAGDH